MTLMATLLRKRKSRRRGAARVWNLVAVYARGAARSSAPGAESHQRLGGCAGSVTRRARIPVPRWGDAGEAAGARIWCGADGDWGGARCKRLRQCVCQALTVPTLPPARRPRRGRETRSGKWVARGCCGEVLEQSAGLGDLQRVAVLREPGDDLRQQRVRGRRPPLARPQPGHARGGPQLEQLRALSPSDRGSLEEAGLGLLLRGCRPGQQRERTPRSVQLGRPVLAGGA